MIWKEEKPQFSVCVCVCVCDYHQRNPGSWNFVFQLPLQSLCLRKRIKDWRFYGKTFSFLCRTNDHKHRKRIFLFFSFVCMSSVISMMINILEIFIISLCSHTFTHRGLVIYYIYIHIASVNFYFQSKLALPFID